MLREQVIIYDIRLPRLVLRILIGAGLAVSGVVMQGLFRNPLADPGLVGVSAGAGLGAVVIIVLGGTMTAATLTGRRLTDGLVARRDEVEAWLSLGAPMREAVRPIARAAVFEALVPALDQTRTVGLVTLPGAFVGALLGGASATAAARFQVVVLVGLLCAEAITATVLAYLLGAPEHLNPAE